MMKLFTAGPSPFGRKVKLTLHVLGLQIRSKLLPQTPVSQT